MHYKVWERVTFFLFKRKFCTLLNLHDFLITPWFKNNFITFNSTYLDNSLLSVLKIIFLSIAFLTVSIVKSISFLSLTSADFPLIGITAQIS